MKILIFGGSGHAKVIADIVLAGGGAELVGFLDDNPDLVGCRLFGREIRAASEALRDPATVRDVRFIIGIGRNAQRQAVAARLEGLGVSFADAIHPSAHLGRDVAIGEGTVVMAGAVINPGTKVGRHAIINTGALIDHDCEIEDFVHLSPGCALAGGVRVGRGTQVGIGASVLPGKRLGAGSMVGAGAVVIGDIPDGTRFAGVPARNLQGKSDGKS
jgi:acetyltransferase EpsM